VVDHGDTPFNLRPGAAPAATVGRTRELDLIEQLLAQAVLSGGGGPISMSGRPGLGVTAVLREIADRASSAKWAAGFSTADADLGRTIAATVNAAVERFAARRPGASRLPELRAINDRLRAERPDEPVAVRAPRPDRVRTPLPSCGRRPRCRLRVPPGHRASCRTQSSNWMTPRVLEPSVRAKFSYSEPVRSHWSLRRAGRASCSWARSWRTASAGTSGRVGSCITSRDRILDR
jgi:hypothetical protein